jgi:hypothetical protein
MQLIMDPLEHHAVSSVVLSGCRHCMYCILQDHLELEQLKAFDVMPLLSMCDQDDLQF